MKQFQDDLRDKIEQKWDRKSALTLIDKKCDKEEFVDLYRHYLRMSTALDPLIRNQRGLRRLMDAVREENTMAELGVEEGDRGGLDKNQVIKRF